MNKSIVLNLVPNKSNYIKINIISNIISMKNQIISIISMNSTNSGQYFRCYLITQIQLTISNKYKLTHYLKSVTY